MTTAEPRKVQAWNGPSGHPWATRHRRFDALLGEADEVLFAAAALAPGDRVLDLGCGAGATTRTAARLAAPGHALGVDISVPLIERARARAAEEGVPGAAFEAGDAQKHPFAPGGYDVAISLGGVTFSGDPVAAFANVARALRPGGRLVLVCPRPPDAAAQGSTALTGFTLGPATGARDAAPTAPDPAARAAGAAMSSLSEPYRINAVLHRVFERIAVRPVDVRTWWGDAPADADATTSTLARAPARAGVWLVQAVRRDDAGA
ncbi:class I SAM-dependent methyltransferase [Streptomyces sp. NPDC049813]|uniref:class I SAM-dependent methyltransferase n=1 Tax=Streptomyces sp. NPDC049813 TaxID=3365597 RepID=UPI0037A0AF24